MKTGKHSIPLGIIFGLLFQSLVTVRGSEPADSPLPAEVKSDANGDDVPPGLVSLNKQKTVLLDAKGKRLLLKSKIVLREGMLEMLCCLKQTKEHESILSVDAKAYTIHAGLLALGVEQGTPVRYEPEFQAATGTPVDIYVQWVDKNKKRQRVRAQELISRAVHRFYAEPLERQPDDLTIPRETKLRYDAKNKELTWYGQMTVEERDDLLALSRDKAYTKGVRSFYERSQPEEMKAGWVFVGSSFFVDPKTGEKFYQAEGGDVICVANFPTALIDVTIPSSASGNENLLYEAYTERIPPIDTDVLIEIIPDFDQPVEAVKPK
ncbi:MAG: YdjY domain-containing protein [Planctomycetota bacterium]|nr:YdjY domain-containing protein [Planctomycetota bacterium]